MSIGMVSSEWSSFRAWNKTRIADSRLDQSVVSGFSHARQLDAHESNPGHLQKQQSVAKTLDIGFAVCARQVANGNVDNSKSQNSGRVEQLKITERIEVAEITPPSDHALVVAALDEFRPAQRIADAHIQNAAKHFRKENISQPVEKAHGIAFHRVNQPVTVD